MARRRCLTALGDPHAITPSTTTPLNSCRSHHPVGAMHTTLAHSHTNTMLPVQNELALREEVSALSLPHPSHPHLPPRLLHTPMKRRIKQRASSLIHPHSHTALRTLQRVEMMSVHMHTAHTLTHDGGVPPILLPLFLSLSRSMSPIFLSYVFYSFLDLNLPAFIM